MKQESPAHENPIDIRLQRLRKIIKEEEKELAKQTSILLQNLFSKEKYKQHREVLKERIQFCDEFVKNVSETFFTFISDCQYIYVTPQIQIMEKIDNFRKNTLKQLKKLTKDLDNKNIQFKNDLKNCKNCSQELEQQEQVHDSTKKKNNLKFEKEKSVVLTEWLLKNFERPYPQKEQRNQMTKLSKIGDKQIQIWFINARERIVKNYLQLKE